ncbi:hypothetical protein AB7942_24025 [Neobacillus sp. BF23-41]|uniref:hypothetical protein n=1 Tax=Neobacillus sp. BF23-41 TaxID=3240280 RepID=UPI0034E54BA4
MFTIGFLIFLDSSLAAFVLIIFAMYKDTQKSLEETSKKYMEKYSEVMTDYET